MCRYQLIWTNSMLSIFRRGAGSQLMHNELSGGGESPDRGRTAGHHPGGMAEARGRLTRQVRLYRAGHLSVGELVISLFQLFSTNEKYSLMADVRKYIATKDLETFDYLVFERRHTAQIDGNVDTLGEAIKQIRGSTRHFKINPPPHKDTHSRHHALKNPSSAGHENNVTKVEVYPVPKNSTLSPLTNWNENSQLEDDKLDFIASNRTSFSKQTAIENSLKDIDLNEYCRTKKKPNSEIKKWPNTSSVLLNNKTDGRLFRANSVPHDRTSSMAVHHNTSTETNEASDRNGARTNIDGANDSTSFIEPPTPFRSDHHPDNDGIDGLSSMGGQPGRYSDRAAGRRVLVPKTKPTLGISIEGGADTKQPFPRIIKMQCDGSAFDSQALQVGDILLSVNGQHIYGMEHRVCARTIAHAFKTSQVLELFIANDHDRSTIE